MSLSISSVLHLRQELLRQAAEDVWRPLPSHDQAWSDCRRQSASRQEAGGQGRHHRGQGL